ncbi:dehydrogenase E1 component family protein [Cardiosporidium cionae]|uniref:2-oxoisovalerate dehydrogenase subunit alpha n=1 Tax=Cardiosporidium cionae TaxID=476202 RepID=A0ABQ7JE10_9APIC|nr:dehydrogenase E1 component family protein [Cardiosporidium cionae]|eukprot:KAF8821875.1 dehydrogenase E1 component family protein [Cardiosporidium cionae]
MRRIKLMWKHILKRGPLSAVAARHRVVPPQLFGVFSRDNWQLSTEEFRGFNNVAHFSSSKGTTKQVENAANSTPTDIYHAGLLNTAFTQEINVSKESPIIPIFRVLNTDGSLAAGWKCPFSKDELLETYKFMLRLALWDDMLYSIQRQGRISFYIQNQGEEAVQTGIARALSLEDTELGVLMWRGFTLEDALNQCYRQVNEIISHSIWLEINLRDPGKGRQMPISYSKKDINLLAISTPLTTQVPHAAGAGYAMKIKGSKSCAVTFFGEGAASEGDFHAAMNFASVLKSQTLFVCRNNGYAISTPAADQYAGDGIAIRGLSYGMRTIRVDGNDLFAVYLAAKECREICINNSEPVCLEMMTYRMGHHSTSDDSTHYRAKGEMEAWSREGVHPIARVRTFLVNSGWWLPSEDNEIKKEAKETMLAAIKECEKVKKHRITSGLFDDVYAEPVWNIQVIENMENNANRIEQNSYLFSTGTV